jgi:hypothetical protein
MAFGTRAWEKVESMHLDQVRTGRDRVWQASRGHAYGEEPGAEDMTQPYCDDEPANAPPAEDAAQ